MTLQLLIKNNAEVRAACATAEADQQWQPVIDLLTVKTIERKNSTLRDARWLMNTFDDVVDVLAGETEADVILATLQASTIPRVRTGYESMVSGGIDLSADQVQALIQLLADTNEWGGDLCERLLQNGVWYESLADQHLASEPTIEAVKSAWFDYVVDARLANATALFRESINVDDSQDQLQSKLVQAWLDVGA